MVGEIGLNNPFELYFVPFCTIVQLLITSYVLQRSHIAFTEDDGWNEGVTWS